VDSQFTAVIQKLAAERGKEVLYTAAGCRAFLADYTRGLYDRESRLLLKALETGAAKTIAETTELDACKARIARNLEEEHFLSPGAASGIVAMLALVLRGDTAGIRAENAPQSPQAAQPPPQAVPPEPKPKKKHTLRNVLIAAAAALIAVWAANSGGSPPPVDNARNVSLPAQYSGTMVQENKTLPIRLTWGGLVNGEAVNTSYLYTKHNIPIPLSGFVDEEGVLYLQEHTESEGVFVFENFTEGAGVLAGVWVDRRDTSNVYGVTLTKE
jgi:hypothetical protein